MSPNANLDQLKAQRRDIAGRLGVAMEAQSKLREATNAEGAALAAIGALGAAEIASVKRWAEAGGRDAMPEPDAAERRRLAEALVAAQARGAAAQGALAGFDESQRELSAELHSINARISEVALDRLEERHRGEVERIAALLQEHIADRLARACALHSFLVEAGQRCQAQGRTDDARAYFTRASRVGEASPPFDIAPVAGAVLAKMEVWSARFAELTADAPAGNVVAIGGAAA